MTKYIEVKVTDDSNGSVAVCLVNISAKNHNLAPGEWRRFAIPQDTGLLKLEAIDPEARHPDVLPPREDWANAV